jgi:hypothetical protein
MIDQHLDKDIKKDSDGLIRHFSTDKSIVSINEGYCNRTMSTISCLCGPDEILVVSNTMKKLSKVSF